VRRQVYVVSFPDGRGKVQISTAGGVAPKWTRGGKEIVYNDFEGTMMAVEIDASRGLRAGTPKPLFQLPEGAGFGWDVTADGERFLVVYANDRNNVAHELHVVSNWFEELKRILPAK